LWLVAERDLDAQCFNLALLPIRTTNDECSTSALFATNRCYVLGGLSALNLILKICVVLLGVSVIAKNVKPTKNMNKNVKKQVLNVHTEKNVIGWQRM